MDVYPYAAGSTAPREDLVDGIIDVLVSWSAPHPEFLAACSPRSRMSGV